MKHLLLGLTLCIQALGVGQDANFIVHILSYVRKDYSEAVDESGKIKSGPEYQEQLDFVQSAIDTAEALPVVKQNAQILSLLHDLLDLVKRRQPSELVARTCVELQGQVMKTARIETAPLRWPNRNHGKDVYARDCASCHGAGGKGDGPSGQSLNPRPTNFHDASRMDGSSPFELFSTIKMGVPGTGMASFDSLSDDEIWDLAFYVAGVRHEGVSAAALPSGLTLQEVASTSDRLLSSRLKREELVALRLHQPQASDEGAAALAKAKLKEVLVELSQGNRAGAKQLAVIAYLEGVEPIEPRLRARDSSLVVEIEQRMADVRSAIDAGHPLDSVVARVKAATDALSRAEQVLKAREASAGFTFSVAAGIVLREAFEAVLIIITLLGVIRSIGSQTAARFVHAGWMVALGLGVLTWFFSGWLMVMSGAQRELLEGSVSFLAVAVLLYFGFWLHRKTEIGRWRAFLSDMVKTAVDGKNLIGLAAVSFMAVFREAFETVLFLRALLLESGVEQQWALLAGVLVSFFSVVVLAAALLRFSVRIPMRQLFALSSLVMVLLSFILAGKGVHSFQETGFISSTSFPLQIRFEQIGLYPTYETYLAQALVLGICVLFWFSGRRPLERQTA